MTPENRCDFLIAVYHQLYLELLVMLPTEQPTQGASAMAVGPETPIELINDVYSALDKTVGATA